MDNDAPSMLKATVIGGFAAGLVSSIPIISLLNCACCSLVVGGGFLAAYIYSRDCERQAVEFRPASGAMVGLVAAMFFALTTVIVVAGTVTLSGVSITEQTEMFFEEAEAQLDAFGQEFPPEADAVVDFFVNAGAFLLFALMFFWNLLLAAVFSTVGGLIGGALFQVEVRPPEPPPAAPGEAPPPPGTAPQGPGSAPPAGG